jgi:HEAT repeat protein
MFRTCFALGIVLLLWGPAVGAARAGDEEQKIERWRTLLLNSKNYKERTLALKELKVRGTTSPGILEDVIKMFRRTKDEQLKPEELTLVRIAAADWIGHFKSSARKAIPALKDVLGNDPSDEVKEAAARALGGMGDDAEDAVKELAAALLSKNVDLRTAAAETLLTLKDKAEPALPQVLQALRQFKGKSDEPLDRIYLVQIAVKLPDRAISTVPVLSEVVGDAQDEPKVRKAAAEGLGRLGAAARTAIPTLEKAFRDSKADAALRRAALQAFDAVGGTGKAAWPGLQELLQDKEAALRLAAVRVAGPVGKDEPAVIKALEVVCLKDNDVEVRLAAIQELGRLGPVAKEAVPTLMRVATDSRPSLRAAAKVALKQIQGTP